MSQTPTNPVPAKTPATAVEKQLLWLVRNLVVQGCTDERFGQALAFDGPTPVFSQFIGIYAQAIALLADYGLVTGLTDNGGRVVSGNIIPPVETAKTLQTGMFDPRAGEALQTTPEIGDHL